MQLQFTHDVGAVCFSRLDTDAKRRVYFLAALAFRKQLHNFPFARSEPVAERCGKLRAHPAFLEIRQHYLCCARRQKWFVIGESFNRDNQIPIRVRLYDVPAHAGLENIPNQLVRVMHRQNQNFGVRRFLADSASGVDAV